MRPRRRRRGKHQKGTRMGAAIRRHPWRTGVGSVLAVFALLVANSYVDRLAQPGNESTSEKTVEWLRDNHLGSVVNYVERKWYTSHPPRVGGVPRAISAPVVRPEPTDPPPTTTTAPTLTATSAVAASTTTSTIPPVDHLPAPAPIGTPARHPVPGEGRWFPLGTGLRGVPGMYTTQVRPDAVHTSYLVLAVWMDPKVVRFQLHPGLEVPGGSWTTPPRVPDPIGDRMVAAFNGGFRMKDALGGFYADGTQRPALRAGAATLVLHRDGTADVTTWGRGAPGPDVVAARQNLALIVDHGQLVPNLDENPGNQWGHTVGNKVFVWRSGVGITADGALVYVGGPSLSARALGDTLLRCGAVRAMELDINYAWVTFNVYQASHGVVHGTKLLPEMHRPGDRYLGVDSRDFIEVSLRG